MYIAKKPCKFNARFYEAGAKIPDEAVDASRIGKLISLGVLDKAPDEEPEEKPAEKPVEKPVENLEKPEKALVTGKTQAAKKPAPKKEEK